MGSILLRLDMVGLRMARKRNIEGLEMVQRVFRELPRENLERITNALNKGADDIAKKARTFVPVGEYSGAGDLKASIDVDRTGIRLRRDGRAAVVFVVAGTPRDGGLAYAFQQEFGRAPGPDGHPGHDEQAFMFPAYYALRQRVRGRIKREIKRAARAVAAVRRG